MHGGLGAPATPYPATSHRLNAVDVEARSHDAVGNITSVGSKTITYNDANRMNAVKQGDAVLESYAYNHRGERVLRTPGGGAAQITLYDEAGRWLGNYSATGQAQQQAIWLDNYPVALINTPATGVPELAYVQPDHLGTPRVVIDSMRDVAIWDWSNKREVFGNQIPSADPDGDGVAFELALRFPGQQVTNASGLFYNYQREYESRVGRYTQSDPIGLIGRISTFTYVGSNLQLAIDPEGLEGIGPWNNSEMNNVTSYVPANNCEREAVADLLLDLVSLTSMVSFAMDSVGVDINFYENPGVHFGEYGAKTPYAAAGHMLDAAASRQDAKAAKGRAGRQSADFTTRLPTVDLIELQRMRGTPISCGVGRRSWGPLEQS